MPDSNKTLIAVVLDRSGSMASLRESTVGGLNIFLDGQRKLPGEVILHFVQFDDVYEYKRFFTSLKEVPSLTQEDFQPRGSTALLDAIGRTIQEVGSHLKALPEAQRAGKVIVVVQTDGFENASREYNHARIQDMIKHQRDKYAWEFVFLAAGQDAIISGAQMGFLANQSLSYNANDISTSKAFASVTRSIGTYRVGASANAVYSAQDQADTLDDSKLDLTTPDPTVVVDTSSEKK